MFIEHCTLDTVHTSSTAKILFWVTCHLAWMYSLCLLDYFRKSLFGYFCNTLPPLLPRTNPQLAKHHARGLPQSKGTQIFIKKQSQTLIKIDIQKAILQAQNLFRIIIENPQLRIKFTPFSFSLLELHLHYCVLHQNFDPLPLPLLHPLLLLLLLPLLLLLRLHQAEPAE